tara:strand:+ start:629 stop:2011 length:1383 start_codon:yes stop_codon:yes gene_type:complete
MANSYLSKSASSGNSTTFTISAWIKRTVTGTATQIFNAHKADSIAGHTNFGIDSNDRLDLSTWSVNVLTTNRRLRDISAWYHVVVQVDSTNSTADDRVKMWINGVQETNFSTRNNPSSSQAFSVNDAASTHTVGAGNQGSGRNQYFNGYISHFVLVDGSVVAPTAFGEADSTTGQWKFKSPSGITFGTNGVHLKFENSAALGADSSGQSNTYTANGNLKQSNSTPTNTYCNVMTNSGGRVFGGNLSITNAGTTGTETANGWQMALCSQGVQKGKWYYEYKIQTLGNSNGYHKIGFASSIAHDDAGAGHLADTVLDGGYAFYCQNGNLEVRTNAAVISGYSISDLGVSFSLNDIMCLALDLDNGRAYFRKNGDAWIKSANPVTGTNGLDITADFPVGFENKFLMPGLAIYYGGVGSINFGTGFFGTDAIASAGSNGNGSLFEFDVPTGYYALNTKNINTYG